MLMWIDLNYDQWLLRSIVFFFDCTGTWGTSITGILDFGRFYISILDFFIGILEY